MRSPCASTSTSRRFRSSSSARGAATIASQHKQYPWTMGLLPSNLGEGAIYGRQIVATKPKAKIGVLYENDEYGQELLAGLKRGLGSHANQIVVDGVVRAARHERRLAGAVAQGVRRRHVRHLRAAEAGDPGVRRRREARLEADGVRHVGVDRSGGDVDRASQRGRDGRRRRDVDRVPARPDEPDPGHARPATSSTGRS